MVHCHLGQSLGCLSFQHGEEALSVVKRTGGAKPTPQLGTALPLKSCVIKAERAFCFPAFISLWQSLRWNPVVKFQWYKEVSGKMPCFLSRQCSSCCTRNVPLPKLTPVNLILIFLRQGKKKSLPIPPISMDHFFYMALKGLGTESLRDHGSLNWAEDVPSPPLQGESYFFSAIMDGATRMCAVSARIQDCTGIEHLLPKTCRVQHPRGAWEFGYTIKKQEDLIYICSLNLTWTSAAFQHLIFFTSDNRK